MTKFTDQLFTDLMHEHSATLEATRLPAATRGHSAVKRGAWLAGGAGTLAVGITAALAATSGGGAAAYAVTPHPDGTVTVGISKPSGIAGANTTLTTLGDRVVVVPVRAGCPSLGSLPAPVDPGKGQVMVSGVAKSADGSITVDAHGVPQGDVLVLAVEDTGHGISMGASLTRAPAPSCVSEPAGFPPPGFPAPGGQGTGHRSGGGQGSGTFNGSLTTGPQGTKGAAGAGQKGSGPVIRASSGTGPALSTNGG
jgi:hypothetical protein